MLSLSNKLSLTTQPVYKFVNKYSIDFDGVDDRIITDGADTVAQPTTYSFWCKSSTTGENRGVFGHGADRQGGFHFNYLTGGQYKPLLWLGSNLFVFWNDISQQDDGEWHHWVVYSDPNDITNSKLYVDGVLQTVSLTQTGGSLDAYTESLTIGSERQVGGNSFEGKIDEFAVYDRELTQAEITRMYNTYYSANRVANGNFAQIGNEEVTNGDFSQIGSEEVINGDFATDSNWTKQDGWTISSGQAHFHFTGTGNRNLYQNVTTVGKFYKFTFEITSLTQGSIRNVSTSITDDTIFNTVGVHTLYYKADIANLYLKASTDAILSIDNVSVKEVGQDWTFETGWSMTDGKAISTGSERLMQSFNHNNKIYQYSFEVSDYVSGNLRFRIGNGATERVASANGVYTGVMQSAGGLNYIIFGDTGVPISCSVDNVSVKEVGQHWTFGTGWSMGDGKVIGVNATGNLEQSISFTNGGVYKISFTISDYVSGQVRLQTNVQNSIVVSANGTYTESLTMTTDNKLLFNGIDSNPFNGSIDNIVVQELKHDATNLMLNHSEYQSANPLITSTKSMEFDGTDDYLNLGVLPNSFTTAYSLSTWLFTETGTGAHQILSTGQGALSQVYQNGTGLKLQILGGTGYNDVIDADFFDTAHQNTWVHLVLVYNGSTIKAYRNGIEVGSASLSGTLNSITNEANIGRWQGGGEVWDGKITELGLYDRALTSLEVASLYNQGMPTNLLVNRNNYQSGNPTVFNTKQVDFDGSDDRLEINNSLSAGTYSVSCWVKRNTIPAAWNYLVDFRRGSAGSNYLAFNSTGGISVTSGTVYVDGIASTTAPNDTEWHHIVATGMSVLGNSNMNIGARYTGSDVIDADMSQVGLWTGTLTADEVSSLYNHGLPIDLSTDQAAYASSSNLVGYWRMGSGTLDTYPLIADQTNATLGSELVTNGDFATNSDWTLQSSWTISGGKANYDAVTTQHYIKQTMSSIAVGTTVKVQFDILDVEAGKNAFFKLECSGDPEAIFGYTTFSEGTYTYYHTIATAFDRLNFVPLNTSTGGAFSIDNVSVKEVNGNPAIMTNQTSSDIENGSPYANLVTNGTFDTDSDWSFIGDTEISGGYAVFPNAAGSYLIQVNVVPQVVKNYTLQYEVIETNGSSLYLAGGSNAFGTITLDSSLGVHTVDVTSNGTQDNLQFWNGGVFVGKIDNVTLAETNTGLQGYWKMGDGTNDEYPVIYDQTNPTLGSELVTNGDFSSGTTDWSAYQGNLSVSNGDLLVTATANSDTRARTNITTVVGKTYLVTAELKSMSGTKVGVANANNSFSYANNVQELTSTGNYNYYFTAAYTNTSIVFKMFDASTGETFSIDNVSAKEVQGNPTTMTNMVEGNITNQYPLTKIRNYYRMGDGILDGYPLIADQTNPSLGSELVTNGDFSNGTTGWTTGNSGVLSIVDGALVVTGDGGSFASAKQIITGVVGKTYKLTGKVAVVTGSYNVRVEADQPSWLNLFTTSSTDFVNFEAYFVCVNTSIDLRFTIYNAVVTSSDKIKIDDISLKEVNGNPGTMTNMSASDIILDTPNEPN